MGNIDIRIFKLNKWYVPKTRNLNGQGKQIVIGYFDDVEIRKAKDANLGHYPFMTGYLEMIEWKTEQKKELVDHSSQEQMIFTNIREEEKEEETGFTDKEIEQFWEDNKWPYLFITMIHISHTGKVEAAFRKIKEVFNENYLSYISFDYCDIIIFAKKIYIKDYLNKIKQLFQRDEDNLFFDTFSMVSFNDTYVSEKNLPEESEFESGSKRDKFQATINLSIRDYEQFQTWYQDLDTNIVPYNMFGRHDVSIVKEDADTGWLLRAMEKLHEKKNQDIFWTFETYIKIKEEQREGFIINVNPKTEKIYQYVQNRLEEKIKMLRSAVEQSLLVNKSNFILPVCEVRDCICSIIKNGFAEELIYCIYESFEEFITYMTETIKDFNEKNKHEAVSEKKIAESYDNYFTALNALVNSTMHSDRQFIQATTFNAIFYSVPPKIMSFYNAYIDRLKRILSDKEKAESITYLIYPSFSPEMSTEKISLNDKPPCGRILKVKINEKALYDMTLVTFQLVHELAHNIGNDIRCRTIRTKNMFRTLIRFVIHECGIMDKMMMDSLDKFLNEIWLKEIGGEYLDDFIENSRGFLYRLSRGAVKDVPRFLKKIYKEVLEKDEFLFDEMLDSVGLDDSEVQKQYLQHYLPQYCSQRGLDLSEEIQKLYTDSSNIKMYMLITELLYKTYYECYADLQMILVLKISLEDYLNIFIKKENIAVDELVNNLEDMVRISTVFKVMVDCGIWKKSGTFNGKISELINSIEKSNDKVFPQFVKEEFKDIICDIRELADKYMDEEVPGEKRIINENADYSTKIEIIDFGPSSIILPDMYEYLLHVIKAALSDYQDVQKKEEIEKVRNVVKIMLKTEDIMSIYNCIEEELEEYGKVLFKI